MLRVKARFGVQAWKHGVELEPHGVINKGVVVNVLSSVKLGKDLYYVINHEGAKVDVFAKHFDAT